MQVFVLETLAIKTGSRTSVVVVVVVVVFHGRLNVNNWIR